MLQDFDKIVAEMVAAGDITVVPFVWEINFLPLTTIVQFSCLHCHKTMDTALFFPMEYNKVHA